MPLWGCLRLFVHDRMGAGPIGFDVGTAEVAMSRGSWTIFDLGGVLFEFDGTVEIAKLLDSSLASAHALLVKSRAVEAFETGRIDATRFAEDFAAELGLAVTADEMLDIWAAWERGPKPGAIGLLKSLKKTGPIACLTNNNAIHWERLTSRHQAEVLFDKCYASHEIGLHKPDLRLFQYVTDDLGVGPEEIVYFDDRADIIEAAKAFGFVAHQATSPAEIRSILAS